MRKTKQNPVIEELKKLTEAVNLLKSRTQNDSYLLSHQAQEIQVVKNELGYITSKVKYIASNPFVRISNIIKTSVVKYQNVIIGILLTIVLWSVFLLGRMQ